MKGLSEIFRSLETSVQHNSKFHATNQKYVELLGIIC